MKNGYYFGRYSSKLAEIVPRSNFNARSTRFSDELSSLLDVKGYM